MTNQTNLVFKFTIVGAMGSGKSSLLRRFTQNKFVEECTHTIGVEFASRVVEIMNEEVKIQIWDTAGQERFRAISRSYFRGATCTFLVFDITRRSSYNQLETWLDEARNIIDPNSLIVVIGNKADIENREISREEGEQFAKENELLYMETSAKSGEKVDDAFLSAANEVYKRVKNGALIIKKKEKKIRKVKPKINDYDESYSSSDEDYEQKKNQGCC
ncbi:rab2a member ras oncogene family [Anaeramoeba flamelloides]|uniref:Rab2a member ras oncogene family n=1 Tax=Anaeramoeba flamelloides TaxID=1746091 RepID=A0AAV8ACP3_9EUKA|nr:rab2a member ras oncogene family [Anaeramoeba flamelloides]